jgi:hypothetical protein
MFTASRVRPGRNWHLQGLVGGLLGITIAGPAAALDRPWIGDVFFYWYSWDGEEKLGNWTGGVYHTPLVGYYDSLSYEDNYRELWMASEWGLTHHFMDYWAPTWKDRAGQPREALLMRAAEQLQQEGYDIFMAYYQDGEDFEMQDFAANMNPGRDVYLGLKNYASSPAWPKLHGRPFQLVYGRNGQPKLTPDQAGFREALRERYGTLEALNQAWGSSFQSWEEVRLDFSSGQPRADSIRYQYQVWERDWARLEERVRDVHGFPGFKASFDVGYSPYQGFGYSNFARVFGGPHSYAGIFGPPHEQDIERFIQSIVAKYYDTVFFDHFKNFYHDWEIRIPGTAYPPEPLHFDRFWVGDLLRYAEAVLHLSWNEWWEGSNLEPCYEYGKTYCEKNLFYATLMKLAFPSIRNYARNARVAVLLNDWQFLVGARDQADLYETLRILRERSIPFDLIPDDFVTLEKLAPFKLVIAPSASVGFGQNAANESISQVLQRWLEGASGRHLIVSGCPEWATLLGLQPLPEPAAEGATGPDMNVFIDVGEEGDDRFLVEGASQRENWGQLPPEAFGATDRALTVRWTPAVGEATTFVLPASPNRDHTLRLAGSAIRSNLVTVRVNGQYAGTFALSEGYNQYEGRIPAAALGGRRLIELQLVYARRHVPQEIDPQRWPNEARVCNLALDWLQFSTANVKASREQNFTFPEEQIVFSADAPGPLANRTLTLPYRPHARLTHPQATCLARYTTDQAPHTLLLPVGKNQVAYVNGSLGSVLDRDYLDTLVTQWAQAQGPHRILGESVQGTVLVAGRTLLALAYNNDITQARPVKFRLHTAQQPVAEVRRLSVDGRPGGEVDCRTEAGKLAFEDTIRYYGVYEVVLCPVRLETPELLLHPGEKRAFPVTLTNRTATPVAGTVRLESIIPTLGSDTVSFNLPPQTSQKFDLPLEAKPTVDWGLKTVTFKLTTDQGSAYFWRTLQVERNPDLQPTVTALSSRQPQLPVGNVENGFIRNAPARNVRLQRGGPGNAEEVASYGDIQSGATSLRPFPVAEAAEPGITEQSVQLVYDLWGQTVERPLQIRVAHFPLLRERPAEAPAEAVARLLVANASDDYLENYVLTLPLADLHLPAGTPPALLFVREASGNVVPSQVDFGREFSCLTMLPPRSVVTLWICQGESEPAPTDLQIESQDLGSGHGLLKLRNSVLSLTLDEAQGGTATSLISQATGQDYGAGSFGVAYGSFGTFDPFKPAVTTSQFIREKKVYQRETPGKIRLTARGPLRAVVEVEWRDAQIRAQQVYELRAYADHFRLQSRLVPQRTLEAAEIVVVDGRFRRNRLTKIFPNFTGLPEAFAQNNPHAGWRQAPYVPPVATLMTLPDCPESLSWVVRHRRGVDGFRQGFWPEKRPEPGPAVYGQVEYLAHGRGLVELEVYVKLHRGHQRVAQLWQKHLDEPPLTAADPLPAPPPEALNRPRKPARTVDPPWWNGYWHYRAPIVLSAPAGGEAPGPEGQRSVVTPVNLTSWLTDQGQALEENSLRLVEYGPNGELRGPVAAYFEKPPDFDPAKNAVGRLIWTPTLPPARFYLYFDTVAHGPKRPPSIGRPVSSTLLDGGFEADPSLWSMDRARVVPRAGRSGAGGQLSLPQAQGISLLANASLRVVPQAHYRLKFWARTSTPGLSIRANFYFDARYDFPQIPIALTADGAWHEYLVTLPTGDFPLSIQPVLRLWLIDQAGSVDIDDVSVERLNEPSDQGIPGQLGAVEQR